jgi:hypothetical protein
MWVFGFVHFDQRLVMSEFEGNLKRRIETEFFEGYCAWIGGFSKKIESHQTFHKLKL